MNKIAFYLDEVDRLRTNEPVSPVTCEIDPSDYCQNECSFCISGSNKNDGMMSAAFFRMVMRQLEEAGVQSITFTGGGEPTYNPDFNSFAEVASYAGFKLGLITNGILLDRVDTQLFNFVRISLDAGSSEVYEAIKGTGCFSDVIENIRRARSYCSTLGLSYVIDGQPEGDLQAAESLAEELGVDYIQFKPENGTSVDRPALNSPLSLYSAREKGTIELACVIAGLIGIVTADGRYVFCCQHRYDPEFTIADLNSESLADAVAKRVTMQYNVDRSKCVSCRYAAYAKAYTRLQESKNAFLRHREFL